MSRIYTIEDKHYYSVTTILGMLDKPTLVPWAAKMTAAKFKELVLAKLPSDLIADDLDEIEILAKKDYRNQSKTAMSYGTIVHDLIENYCKTGIDPDLKDDAIEVQTAWAAWMEWVTVHDFEPLCHELEVCNPVVEYAGRLDTIGKVDGVLTLIDFKTSTGIYDDMLYQLAAYNMALTEEYFDIKQAGILRLDKATGLPEWKVYDLDDLARGWEIFRHLAYAYRLIKGEPQPKKERTKK